MFLVLIIIIFDLTTQFWYFKCLRRFRKEELNLYHCENNLFTLSTYPNNLL